MEIIEFISFKDQSYIWDRFCLTNDMTWFWHLSYRMKHALNCSFTIRSENHSFFLKDQGKIVAIVPLTVDYTCTGRKETEIAEMTYGGNMVPIPVVDQGLTRFQKDKYLKIIFSEIDRIAVAYNVKRLAMTIPLTLSYCRKYEYYNFLMKFGFNDISLNTQIIDLKQSEKQLCQKMRKGHRHSIKNGMKYLDIKIFAKDNISEETVEEFKLFYFRIAGKVTHPDEVFRLLFCYLKNDLAVMGQALYRGKVVGYIVAIYYKSDSYYLMSASEKRFSICSVGHLLSWEIMKYLRAKKISHYEMGIQYFGISVYDQPSLKEISISSFKRGFGGVTIPRFIGEKFYSYEYFTELWQERISRYKDFMQRC